MRILCEITGSSTRTQVTVADGSWQAVQASRSAGADCSFQCRGSVTVDAVEDCGWQFRDERRQPCLSAGNAPTLSIGSRALFILTP